MGGIGALILFIGITWYPEAGIEPDFWVVPVKTIGDCNTLRENYELSVLSTNSGQPWTTWVHPQAECIPIANDVSKQDL